MIPAENILFASEMLGAVRGADPETGIEWDDTKTLPRRGRRSTTPSGTRCSRATPAGSTPVSMHA